MISRKVATNAKLARVSLRAAFFYLSCIPFIRKTPTRRLVVRRSRDA